MVAPSPSVAPSFRDPAGAVIHRSEKIYRVIGSRGLPEWTTSNFFSRIVCVLSNFARIFRLRVCLKASLLMNLRKQLGKMLTNPEKQVHEARTVRPWSRRHAHRGHDGGRRAGFVALGTLAIAPPLRKDYPLEFALIREPAIAGARSLRDQCYVPVGLASRPIIDNYLSTHPEAKLQLGAGPNNMPGWLNTDIEPAPGQAYLDATKPFPMPDRTFNYITSEHVFEHLSYENGRRMLQECYRILKPGGRLRIATPDLSKFVSLFSLQQTPEMTKYLDQKAGKIPVATTTDGSERLPQPELLVLGTPVPVRSSAPNKRALSGRLPIRSAIQGRGKVGTPC